MLKKYVLGLAGILFLGIIIVPVAYCGDANLDGRVDSSDLNAHSSSKQKVKSKAKLKASSRKKTKRKIPGLTKSGDVTLKRGVVGNSSSGRGGGQDILIGGHGNQGIEPDEIDNK